MLQKCKKKQKTTTTTTTKTQHNNNNKNTKKQKQKIKTKQTKNTIPNKQKRKYQSSFFFKNKSTALMLFASTTYLQHGNIPLEFHRHNTLHHRCIFHFHSVHGHHIWRICPLRKKKITFERNVSLYSF